MLLMALSKLGLYELLRIYFLYSCKWRYEYGPLKCSVIVFNETRGQFVKSNRKWLLGPHTVKEEESYKYLGTMFSKYLSLKANIKDASDKLKGTFVLFTRMANIPCLAKKYTNVLFCPKPCMAVKTGVI